MEAVRYSHGFHAFHFFERGDMEPETREILYKLTTAMEELGEYLVMAELDPEEALFIIEFLETTQGVINEILKTLRGSPK